MRYARLPEQTWVLSESISITLDASGNGTVWIGPQRPGQRWRVRGAAVSTTTAVKVPTFNLYRGGPSPGNLLAATYTGSSDSTNDLAEEFSPGAFLTGVWQGGDVDAVATLSLSGDLLIRYPG